MLDGGFKRANAREDEALSGENDIFVQVEDEGN
jgi:hypothetical protein